MTLGGKQLAIAALIIAGARERGLGDAGARIGLITALVESKLRMYANSNVAGSESYPHDAVGSDHDSLNFFQQRVRWWATGTTAERVAKLMDPAYAIDEFYKALKRVAGWERIEPGVVAQKIQVSQFPDRYAEWVPVADAILAAL